MSSHPLVNDEAKREGKDWKISERWSFLSGDIASPWRFSVPDRTTFLSVDGKSI